MATVTRNANKKPRTGSRTHWLAVRPAEVAETVAGATSEAFARWLHCRQGPVYIAFQCYTLSAGDISFRHYSDDTSYCDVYVSMSVCLSVCLSAHITRKPQSQASPNFLCMLPVAMAWSSSGGFAMCYVLPVMLMTVVFIVRRYSSLLSTFALLIQRHDHSVHTADADATKLSFSRVGRCELSRRWSAAVLKILSN